MPQAMASNQEDENPYVSRPNVPTLARRQPCTSNAFMFGDPGGVNPRQGAPKRNMIPTPFTQAEQLRLNNQKIRTKPKSVLEEHSEELQICLAGCVIIIVLGFSLIVIHYVFTRYLL